MAASNMHQCCLLLDLSCAGAVQTKPAFEAALEALRAAGVKLIPMDMSQVMDYSRKHTPDLMFLAYEMPRELSR